MPTRDNNKKQNQDKEQDVFSGNEEKRSPFKDDQEGSDSGKQEQATNEDVYRSRNLEIEKERD